jgi:hypothetical protein
VSETEGVRKLYPPGRGSNLGRMRVLGIHDGHNASAVLLEDGKISYAVQEERLNRIKN